MSIIGRLAIISPSGNNLWQVAVKYVSGAHAKRLRERHRGLNGVDEPVLLGQTGRKTRR